MQTLTNSKKTALTFSWILSILFVVVTVIYYFLAQNELPLFYTLATKQDQLAPKIWLFIVPGVSLLINFIHFFIVRALQKHSELLLKLFVGTTIGLQVLIGFALFRIILITM